MPIEILKLNLGPLKTNCYIVGDTATHDAVVIDPSDQASLLQRIAHEHDWTIRAILATHGHFDHVLASRDLKALTGAPFRIHEYDMPLLTSMTRRVRDWLSIDVAPPAEVDQYVIPGETITVGAIALDVLFTPGHSPGHVSYVLRSEQVVFSGDCLFMGGIGRTDMPGGDYEKLLQSITGQLLPLGDAYTVAPGHMHSTTIGYERQHNPYIANHTSD